MMESMGDYARDVRHFIKLLIGKPDPWWYFDRFEKSMSPQSIARHDSLVSWAETSLLQKKIFENPQKYAESADPLVRQGWELKKGVEAQFKDMHTDLKSLRILIHVPSGNVSPAGFSIFQNILESFRFIGIAAEALAFGESTQGKLQSFKPTVLLTSDVASYLSKIDWTAIAEYRKSNTLLIGLTAGLEEYGNTPLVGRLEWAKKHGVDFYYSYRTSEYVNTRKEYRPFHDAGYTIFSLPFGTNPLIYYPVPLDHKDLDYVFIVSSQGRLKGKKYWEYLRPFVHTHVGCITGPGWSHDPHFAFNRDRDRYLYSRAKVGLNMHLPEQIRWSCEVNERTYQLAACGVPQVTDHAKLLDTLFPRGALFIADTARQYRDHCEHILAHPEEAKERALLAQKTVFEKYTTFHRASDFVTMVASHFKILG